MNRLLLVLPVIVVLALAPWRAEAQDEATKVMVKMRQLDLLNQMLPVLLKPDQIRKILPAIEKARAADAANSKRELDELKKIDPKVDAALVDARTKGLVPTKELQAEVMKLLAGFNKQRALMILQQNDAVLKVVEETLDEGQIKAAANSIVLPDDKGKGLSDRDKLRRWVWGVLMDPLAYDLLVELSKAKEQSTMGT